MKRLIICAALLAASCTDPIAEAEETYRIAKDLGSREDACAAAREVKRLYLEARDRTEYVYWSIRETSNCGPYYSPS